jgi:hypothetical protein
MAWSKEKQKEQRSLHKEERQKYERQYYSSHKEKKIKQQQEYRSLHKEEIKKRAKERYKNNRRYLVKYGITLEEYNALLIEQNNECKICHKHITQSKYAFDVDHEHDTGIVRGLLCRQCNTALGLFREDTEILLSALIYLKGE